MAERTAQIAAGKKHDAPQAFAVNALLGYAVYTSLDRRNYGVAGLMGVFAVTFYAGNFVGAVQGAHRYNKERLQNCADRFERLNAIYP